MAQNDEAVLAAIRAQKEGPPCMAVGRPRFPLDLRKFRTNHLEFADPSFGSLISDKDIPFSRPFPARYPTD